VSVIPIRRRDEDSEWHNLLPASCPSCGCTFFFADDDAAMVWEPGRAWDEGCSDRNCRCHTEPVVGMRREG
jgi:hypothetical protein